MSTLAIGVRKAEPRDAETITAVHDAAWHNAYDGIIPARVLNQMIARRGPRWWLRAIHRGTGILVLEAGGAVTGYATFGANRARNLPQRGEVYELYVAPEYQGVGLGTKLFISARTELVRARLDPMLVWALAENEPACHFYRNAGGRQIARTAERFGDKTLAKLAYGWTRKH